MRPGRVSEDHLLKYLINHTQCDPNHHVELAQLLREECGGDRAARPGGRLTFTHTRRIEQLHWPHEVQDPEPGLDRQRPAGPRGWLDQAIEFWRDQYTADDQRRLADDPDWQHSPARRQLEIERALLDLWRDPVPAAHALHDRPPGHAQSVLAGSMRGQQSSVPGLPGSNWTL